MVIDHEGTLSLLKLPQHFAGPVVKEAMALVHQELEKENSVQIVFDLSECDLVDSSGIGTMVSIAKDLRNRNSQLMLRNLSQDLHQLFIDTGLDKIFAIEQENEIHQAEVDLFESSVDIRLEMRKEIRGDICIFHMAGVMNHPIGSRFFKQQFLLSLASHKRVLLDFEELTFFDSLSISAILNMNKLLKETGGSMRVCGANYIIKDLFATLNIDSIIPLYNTIEDALADWK
jgi:anti-sigma B factor antagonist